MRCGLVIESVRSGSIAEGAGLRPGDRLVTINGFPVRDLIDYEFLSADDLLVLEIGRRSGGRLMMEVVRSEGESLGLTFPSPTPKQCGNNCLFCFVHQLPKGLRPALYVKDEDYRLSFLYGTYITLTNLTRSDLARIRELRLSPLYISVHATDPVVRERLLGRTGLPPVLDVLRELTGAGITLHTQVVLCPGINDGAVLERTVGDLAALYPRVASLAVVPVGLTAHRQQLPVLQGVTPGYAAAFCGRWQQEAQRLAGVLGEPFLFLADEFFLKGGVPFPPLDSYGDFPQLENGVGMLPLFLDEAEELLAEVEPLPPVRVTVVTGTAAYRHVGTFLVRLAQATGTTIDVVAVANRLFGESVTVAGLIGGNDIMAALAEHVRGNPVFIPDVMLKDGEGIFIDDVSVEDLGRALGCEVVVVGGTPCGFHEALRRCALGGCGPW